MMGLVFTDDNFETEALQSDLPVMVDFFADWCMPCKMMAPIVEELAESFAGKVKIGKLNVEENERIAQKYRVMSIPSLLFFKDGEKVETVVGAVSKTELEKKLQQILA